MARREFSNHVKLARWRHCGGLCESCGVKIIGGAQYDHDMPDGLGGEATFDNCRVLCRPCHGLKTHGHDNPIMRKADRAAKAHAGVKRKSRMPGSRDSGWRRRMNGTVERRT